MEQEKVIS